MKLLDEIQFIHVDDEYIIVNLINGASDIIDYDLYNKLLNKKYIEIEEEYITLLKERNYLFDNEEDKDNFLNRLDNIINSAELDTLPNFLIIPTYACNLNCKYCYEQTYDMHKSKLNDEKENVDKQLKFINNYIDNLELEKNSKIDRSNIKITLMGGEPLMKSKKELLEYIFNLLVKDGYSINIISNGYDLDEYIDLINKYKVDFVQITLDGPPSIHDSRRVLHNGNGSFEKIMANLQLALEQNLKIVIRVNVDNENLYHLPDLAKIITNKLSNINSLYAYLYLMQDGGCSGDANVIKEVVGIDELIKLKNNNKEMEIFNINYHGYKFVNSIFNDTPFSPCLRHCAASANQIILDCNGLLYKCWHGIGNKSHSVGNFYNEDKWNINRVNKWKNRTTNNINECKKCNYRYICGTGCPASEHSSFSEEILQKPKCIDYKPILEKVIKQQYLSNKEPINA